MKLPRATEPFVFGLLLSGLMSLITTGIATLYALGFVENLVSVWMTSWLAAWAIAFPSVLIIAPLVRRMTARIVAAPVPETTSPR
ncbi:MAG: DUF2798 domain-containing protein [Hyphomicrobiaceae bacterium]